MAEDTTTTAVRAVASDVSAALGAHLTAIERMAGEQDPAVQAAYDALRAALARYDDLVFDTYGEVTPYVLPELRSLADGFEAVPLHEGPRRLAVVARWEFVVQDAGVLAERAGEVWDPEIAGYLDAEENPMSAAGAALGGLVDAVGAETVAVAAHEYGLDYAGSTMWVLESAATGGEDEDWRDQAFDDLDAASVIFRADIHTGDD